MNISQSCLDIIKKWEGFKAEAYLDPVGIPTVGYGTTRYPTGLRVKLGERISEAQAEAYLKFETDETVESLNIILKDSKVNQNQFDALVSLCYNIGVGGFRESTILREIKSGNFPAAAAAFMLWNKGTVKGVKKVLPGLTKRRADERALFERAGAAGKPIVVEASAQDTVTRLEGFREGAKNVIVAYRDSEVVEILSLESSLKEELISTLRQYKNAMSFDFAPAGSTIPKGTRIEIVARSAEIRSIGEAPPFAGRLLVSGMSDDAAEIGIATLQSRLKELGYYKDDVDGAFGKVTDAAVRAFQSDVFGLADADGKVGPKTWGKLWGAPLPTPIAPSQTAVGGKHYLLLTRTMTKDSSGCFRLKLDYFKDGQLRDSLFVVSGQPKRQFFRTGRESVRGSYEPLPEGKWIVRDVIWAGAKDVYDKRVHKEGIGPAKIPVDFVPKTGTRRDLIQIHIDWNRSNAPGTAGCIGVASVSDFKRLVTWLRESDPRDLFVDWGLGTVRIP
ncbi:MAG: glycoside hydrolase family protein [Acidobacteria bacterium]|nr:glycoside hydrolase family protein [Acidobacteriota bacterium]